MNLMKSEERSVKNSNEEMDEDNQGSQVQV